MTMKITKITKLRKNSGSMITVFPASFVELFDLKHGDSIKWDAEIEKDKATITVTPISKQE